MVILVIFSYNKSANVTFDSLGYFGLRVPIFIYNILRQFMFNSAKLTYDLILQFILKTNFTYDFHGILSIYFLHL